MAQKSDATQRNSAITPERLDQIKRLMYHYGPSNSWTGTTGALAGMIQDLLAEREGLLARVKELERPAVAAAAGTLFTGQRSGVTDSFADRVVAALPQCKITGPEVMG